MGHGDAYRGGQGPGTQYSVRLAAQERRDVQVIVRQFSSSRTRCARGRRGHGVVPPDWLARQLQCGANAFCGVVAVGDWLDYPPAVREQFLQGEHALDGHPHVHGANMGFSAVAYRQSGGFAPLATGEDVALIQAMHGAGMQVARLASPRVMTSARRHARAPHGFSDFLRRLEQRVGLAADEVVSDVAPLSLLAR